MKWRTFHNREDFLQVWGNQKCWSVAQATTESKKMGTQEKRPRKTASGVPCQPGNTYRFLLREQKYSLKRQLQSLPRAAKSRDGEVERHRTKQPGCPWGQRPRDLNCGTSCCQDLAWGKWGRRHGRDLKITNWEGCGQSSWKQRAAPQIASPRRGLYIVLGFRKAILGMANHLIALWIILLPFPLDKLLFIKSINSSLKVEKR